MMGMLRPKAGRRLEDTSSILPNHREYLPVAAMDPRDRDVRPQMLGSRWQRLKPKIGKAGAIAALAFPIIFLVTWNHLFRIDLQQSSAKQSRARSGAQQTFTVRMNTFRRNDLLKRSAEHFATCDCVSEVQVVWSDQENKPPPLEIFSPVVRPKIRFEVHDTDSLNHRFNVTSPVATKGIFSVDDDLEISCADLQFGFETWQSSQDTMVGYSPRMVTQDPATARFSYRSWRVVRWNGVYNVILTKCCFLHIKHLRTYVKEVPPTVLSYINTHRNCEDIAMSMVVAKYFKTPPLWITGRVKEIGRHGGISNSLSHFDTRSLCVDYFARELKGVALIDTSTRVYPMHSGLLSWL